MDLPSRYGMSSFSDLTLTTPDNVKIKAYLILQPDEIAAKRPTVLLLHANAGNVVSRCSAGSTVCAVTPHSISERPSARAPERRKRRKLTGTRT